MARRVGLLIALLSLTGCVQTTTYEVGVVEEFTRPSDTPVPRPRSTEATRALEAEWPPATAWEPPAKDEFRLRPIYRPGVGLPACATARPDQPCQGVPKIPPPRVFDAAGASGVILRVQSTGRDSPPVIRLDRD